MGTVDHLVLETQQGTHYWYPLQQALPAAERDRTISLPVFEVLTIGKRTVPRAATGRRLVPRDDVQCPQLRIVVLCSSSNSVGSRQSARARGWTCVAASFPTTLSAAAAAALLPVVQLTSSRWIWLSVPFHEAPIPLVEAIKVAMVGHSSTITRPKVSTAVLAFFTSRRLRAAA